MGSNYVIRILSNSVVIVPLIVPSPLLSVPLDLIDIAHVRLIKNLVEIKLICLYRLFSATLLIRTIHDFSNVIFNVRWSYRQTRRRYQQFYVGEDINHETLQEGRT